MRASRFSNHEEMLRVHSISKSLSASKTGNGRVLHNRDFRYFNVLGVSEWYASGQSVEAAKHNVEQPKEQNNLSTQFGLIQSSSRVFNEFGTSNLSNALSISSRIFSPTF